MQLKEWMHVTSNVHELFVCLLGSYLVIQYYKVGIRSCVPSKDRFRHSLDNRTNIQLPFDWLYVCHLLQSNKHKRCIHILQTAVSFICNT